MGKWRWGRTIPHHLSFHQYYITRDWHIRLTWVSRTDDLSPKPTPLTWRNRNGLGCKKRFSVLARNWTPSVHTLYFVPSSGCSCTCDRVKANPVSTTHSCNHLRFCVLLPDCCVQFCASWRSFPFHAMSLRCSEITRHVPLLRCALGRAHCGHGEAIGPMNGRYLSGASRKSCYVAVVCRIELFISNSRCWLQ